MLKKRIVYEDEKILELATKISNLNQHKNELESKVMFYESLKDARCVSFKNSLSMEGTSRIFGLLTIIAKQNILYNSVK